MEASYAELHRIAQEQKALSDQIMQMLEGGSPSRGPNPAEQKQKAEKRKRLQPPRIDPKVLDRCFQQLGSLSRLTGKGCSEDLTPMPGADYRLASMGGLESLGRVIPADLMLHGYDRLGFYRKALAKNLRTSIHAERGIRNPGAIGFIMDVSGSMKALGYAPVARAVAALQVAAEAIKAGTIKGVYFTAVTDEYIDKTRRSAVTYEGALEIADYLAEDCYIGGGNEHIGGTLGREIPPMMKWSKSIGAAGLDAVFITDALIGTDTHRATWRTDHRVKWHIADPCRDVRESDDAEHIYGEGETERQQEIYRIARKQGGQVLVL